MNDVRYLCELTLDTDAPPLREADQVLAIAARAAARRDRVVAATVSLAGVTVAAALVTPALLPTRPPASLPVLAAPVTVASTGVAAAEPSAAAKPTDDRMVYDLLVAGLPAGYTGRSQYPFADPSRPAVRLDQQGGESVMVPMSAHVVVSDGRGEGVLWAYVASTGKPVPTGDLCAEPGTGRDCRVIDVAGVPVVVWTEDDGVGGETLVARRYLQGGHLGVVAGRSVVDYVDGRPVAAGRPALATAFIDPQRLAALAGNPAMLP